ncbi:B3 domain-containing transcription factor FUS3-like [Rutidosis leptorrhynchoides]|uniref:B3 domain-containing transcription factor FUS3-like n=1 Tax=Rutidosis leptorrhynchoides TaxID=125765 RepID=UPI003A9926B9
MEQQEETEASQILAGVVKKKEEESEMGRVGFLTTREIQLPNNITVNVNRKKRMARQRRSSYSNSPFPPHSQVSPPPPPPPPPVSARAIDRQRLIFLFQKELRNSDVGTLRRMVLPKRASEAHLPALESKEGININMDDLDGVHLWTFKYRFWPNNNSRMYVLENTGDFVCSHGLRPKDFIIVYQDPQNEHFVIEGRKASDNVYISSAHQQLAENTCVDEVISTINQEDYEIKPCISSSSFYYPPMDFTSGMSFVYETTCSDEFALDFLGANSLTNNFSSTQSLGAFGSDDNLSLDDFYSSMRP